MTSPDHFSQQADFYAQYRPTYPEALYDWLLDLQPDARLVWDVGTGNGQAALALAKRFPQVWATDLSEAQLAKAPAKSNLRYSACAAHDSPLPNDAADLITIAQALHWFAEETFFEEIRRVAKAGAYCVAWTYALPSITPAVDALLAHYFHSVVGAFWPPQRRHVDEQYARILFPFERISAPAFQIERQWTLDQFLGYLRSWSATQRYVRQKGADPVAAQQASFQDAWGDRTASRSIRWPVTVLAGQVVS